MFLSGIAGSALGAGTGAILAKDKLQGALTGGVAGGIAGGGMGYMVDPIGLSNSFKRSNQKLQDLINTSKGTMETLTDASKAFKGTAEKGILGNLLGK
jgi:hypothetical protein